MLTAKKNIHVSDIIPFFKKHASAGFLALLAVLVIFELIVLNTSVQLVFGSHGSKPVTVVKSQDVRINFENYNQVVQRAASAQEFEPSQEQGNNPFRSVQD